MGADGDGEPSGGCSSDASGTRVGVDVGGTFTDVVTVRDGRVDVAKTPSTPDAPEQGVVDGLDAARERDGVAGSSIGFLGHGTTVATNAVLEGAWADTALLTTTGFRDVLEIGRQARPDVYDFRTEKPAPIVERHRRYGIEERLDESGRVVEPLDEEHVRALAAELRETSVESVAVALLFAFEDDGHERRVRELLDEAGLDCSVSLSSATLPEIREYERTLATALDAALKPVLDRYVGELVAKIGDRGIDAPLAVMQSNGGIVAAEAARERPVGTLLSGPAAGVQGATHVAGRCGFEDLLTMDMGGTSCDVSLVEGGEPPITTDVEVGEYPVSVPSVDVHTTGAGGGSIAWLDSGDALRVGPRSAGARPGPVCYGRGGTEPTVTDAQLLLGRLDPQSFLADDLDADPDAVRAAVAERVADPLGMEIEAAAQGIVDVANANTERALRVVSVERGHDPREFTLVAFGGAGPLHAPALAAALDVPRVLVPRTAGVLSALGLVTSDVLYDHATSRVRRLDAIERDELERTFEAFVAAGREQLAEEGVPAERRRFERSLDLRYVGQSFELSVPLDSDLDTGAVETGDAGTTDPEALDAGTLDAATERFHERHRERYGHADPAEPVELVTVRLRARGVVEPPDLRVDRTGGSVEDAIADTRRVVYDGDARETRVYDRARLPVGSTFDGPAVVEGAESTTVVHPGQRARVDGDANLLVEVDP
jgi:N-methylhydantoinase A